MRPQLLARDRHRGRQSTGHGRGFSWNFFNATAVVENSRNSAPQPEQMRTGSGDWVKQREQVCGKTPGKRIHPPDCHPMMLNSFTTTYQQLQRGWTWKARCIPPDNIRNVSQHAGSDRFDQVIIRSCIRCGCSQPGLSMAERMMIGILLKERTTLHTSQPSIPGIIKSSRMRSAFLMDKFYAFHP